MEKDLFCFDLDNTLIDSEKVSVFSYNYAFKKSGFREVEFEKLVKLLGRPHGEIIKMLTKCRDMKVIEKINRDHHRTIIKYADKAKVLPGVEYTLRQLKKSYELAIISNASHKNILALLRGAKLDKRLFNILIGNDDVEKSKPWPDEILKAEKLLHHEAKFMVGDSIYDVIAGKRAKVKTIAVLSGRYSRSQLRRYKPDYIIKELRDILKII